MGYLVFVFFVTGFHNHELIRKYMNITDEAEVARIHYEFCAAVFPLRVVQISVLLFVCMLLGKKKPTSPSMLICSLRILYVVQKRSYISPNGCRPKEYVPNTGVA